MDIITLFRESFGFFDLLIVVLFFGNLYLLWRQGRKALGIPPAHVRRISSVILELFPVLGILGTVWGLSLALLTLSQAGPGDLQLGPVTRQFGGALTSTFFGLAAVAATLVAQAITAARRDPAGEEIVEEE